MRISHCRFLFLTICLLSSIFGANAKENETWYSEALTAFHNLDYKKCQGLFHKYLPKATEGYVEQNQVSVVPWFESAIALGDWEDAVDSFTKFPSVKGCFYEWQTINGTRYWLNAADLRNWSSSNAPIHNFLWTEMTEFYFYELDYFDKSPFINHLISLGRATLEEEHLILGSSFNAFAQYYLNGDMEFRGDVISLLEKSADLGCSNSLVLLGNIFEDGLYKVTFTRTIKIEKDPIKAFGYWKQLAEKYAASVGWFKCGDFLKNGIVQKDLPEALKCYTTAYELNNSGPEIHATSACRIAEINRDLENYEVMFIWANKALELNYDFANLVLAQAYINGWGCNKHDPKAFSHAQKLLDSKVYKEIGARFLSQCYLNGIGCEVNQQQAISLLKESADKGDTHNTFVLATRAYELSRYDLALQYFDKIMESPSKYPSNMVANAYLTVGKMYRFGRGVVQNDNLADKYAQKAREYADTNFEKYDDILQELGLPGVSADED